MNPKTMTEPTSFVGNISAICVTLVNLVSTLSQLVDEIGQGVPPEAQRLANELAALYSSLGQIKLSLSLLPDQENVSLAWWNTEFRTMMEDCKEIIGILNDIVERSKKVETQYVGAQKWKRVKFTFRVRQVEVVRIRLVWYNILFDKMNSTLGEKSNGPIQQRMDDILDIVEMLKNNRESVKEVIHALEDDNANVTPPEYALTKGTISTPSYRVSDSESAFS